MTLIGRYGILANISPPNIPAYPPISTPTPYPYPTPNLYPIPTRTPNPNSNPIHHRLYNDTACWLFNWSLHIV